MEKKLVIVPFIKIYIYLNCLKKIEAVNHWKTDIKRLVYLEINKFNEIQIYIPSIIEICVWLNIFWIKKVGEVNQ
jgi:hypothetical protein